MSEHSVPIRVEWSVVKKDKLSGEVLQSSHDPNVVVKDGRTLIQQLLFGFATASSLAVGIGASSTTATVNDTQLTYEHIANPTRYGYTDSAGGSFTIADVAQDETITIDSCTYYKKSVLLVTIDGDTDLNTGQPVQEVALFTTQALPATPTSSSGTMITHYILPSPHDIDPGTIIELEITIRT